MKKRFKANPNTFAHIPKSVVILLFTIFSHRYVARLEKKEHKFAILSYQTILFSTAGFGLPSEPGLMDIIALKNSAFMSENDAIGGADYALRVMYPELDTIPNTVEAKQEYTDVIHKYNEACAGEELVDILKEMQVIRHNEIQRALNNELTTESYIGGKIPDAQQLKKWETQFQSYIDKIVLNEANYVLEEN